VSRFRARGGPSACHACWQGPGRRIDARTKPCWHGIAPGRRVNQEPWVEPSPTRVGENTPILFEALYPQTVKIEGGPTRNVYRKGSSRTRKKSHNAEKQRMDPISVDLKLGKGRKGLIEEDKAEKT